MVLFADYGHCIIQEGGCISDQKNRSIFKGLKILDSSAICWMESINRFLQSTFIVVELTISPVITPFISML